MSRFHADIKTIYLRPGEIYITRREPAVVTTVLGSCIAVSMFSGRLGIGAICHGLLPRCRAKEDCDGKCGEGFRFVDCSIRHMLMKFDSAGVARSEIQVKLFGGSDMFDIASTSVGAQNIETALKVIRDEGLSLISSDVGGEVGRKILFDTRTGEILLKRQKKAKQL